MLNTFLGHMQDWVHNILEGHSLDVTLLKVLTPPKGLPVVVAGAGFSLERGIEQLKRGEQIIIANQSSLLRLVHEGIQPDICMVTDSNPIIEDRIERARAQGWKGYVVASTACPQYDDPKVLRFKHFIKGDNPEFEVFNTLLRETDPQITTWIMQVGCVGNASILLASELMSLGITTEGPIYLTGLDYSYAMESSRCYDVLPDGTLAPVALSNEQGPIVKVGGFLTSEVMLTYRHQFAIVNENLGREIFLMNYGFLNDFVETRWLPNRSTVN